MAEGLSWERDCRCDGCGVVLGARMSVFTIRDSWLTLDEVSAPLLSVTEPQSWGCDQLRLLLLSASSIFFSTLFSRSVIACEIPDTLPRLALA